MRFLPAILLFTLTAFAQTDSIQSQNISVISAERLNVVYRGVDNPIKIAVPGAVSFDVSAPGMRKDSIKGPGNYIINPGSGNELSVSIIYKLPDGTAKAERKLFRILGIPAVNTFIDGSYTYSMNREQLMGIIVGATLENFLFPEGEVDVKGFTITMQKKSGKSKTFEVEGNKLTAAAKEEIKKIKKGNIIVIHNIHIKQVCKVQ